MTKPEPVKTPVILEMLADLTQRIAPHIEQIKFLRGHGECTGWKMEPDEDLEDRFRCGCGAPLDDKEEAEE